MIKQRTIQKTISTLGIGMHSGEKVNLKLHPASKNSGITFIRSDLNLKEEIKVKPKAVKETTLCTSLVKNNVKISTVEHLMSAFAGLGIDNITVEVDAEEIPIMDGSALPFVYLIKSAGILEQDEPKKFIRITKEISIVQGDKWVKLKPYNGFKINCEVEFNHPAINKKLEKFEINLENKSFIDEISRARTFGFLKDIEYLRANNLAKGGSLDNAVVLDDYKILNKDGLRYKNEFIKHKVLDAIGDLYIIGSPIIGEFSAFKPGHELNNLLVRKLAAEESSFEYVTFEESLKNKDKKLFSNWGSEEITV